MMRLKSLNRHTAILYFVALNCLLYVSYLQPVSFSQEAQLQQFQEFASDYHKRFQRRPPKGMATWLDHAQRHHCETHNHYEAMNQDLEYFRQQQDLQWDQVIEQAKKYTDRYMAFSLEHHKLTVVDYQGKAHFEKPILKMMKRLLKPVIQHKPPLKSKFVFNVHDTARPEGAHAKYPIFSVCKMDYYTNNNHPPPTSTNTTTTKFNFEYNKANIIDNSFVESRDLLVPWWFSLRRQSTRLWWWPFYGRGIPFPWRKNAITWRGSTTSEWETGPRFQLVKQYGSPQIHKLSNNLTATTTTTTNVDADFAFIRVVQKPKEVSEQAVKGSYRFARHQFYWEMQLRKYIIDVDGNGFTSRFPGLLRSGSLVFKSTKYREWFHGILKPYQHYIPVNYDLSDLVEKVAWAQDHPKKAAEIVQRSRQTVERNFRVQDMQCYMYRLMLEYQALFEEETATY